VEEGRGRGLGGRCVRVCTLHEGWLVGVCSQ
jgi:hypothetical protein